MMLSDPDDCVWGPWLALLSLVMRTLFYLVLQLSSLFASGISLCPWVRSPC